MSSLRATMSELAAARADAEGALDMVGYNNLAVAGGLAVNAFNMYEAPRLGRAPRISRAVLEIVALQAMRNIP